MRVGSRIAAGSALLVVLLVGVLAYHVLLMQDAAKASREATHKYEALTLLLALQRSLANFTEYRHKFLASNQDPLYWEKLQEVEARVETDLASLTALRLPGSLRERVADLDGQWERLFAWLEIAGPPVPAAFLDTSSVGKPNAEERRAQEGVAALSQALEAAIRDDLAGPEEAGSAAKRVSWLVLGMALALCALVILVTVRSIQEPLRRLSRAMQAVAGGQLSHRVELDNEDEFSRLAASFNAMATSLSELDQMKKEFVAHVSHELKNPLVAMQETNQLLVDELAGPLTDKQRRLLELNIESGRRLSAMLSNLLDVSSLEAGAMTYDLKPVDLVGLARFAIQEFEARARERGLELRLTAPTSPAGAPSRCDRDRMIQVLENLLDNAIKLSPAGQAVEVEIRLVDPTAEGLPAAVRKRFAAEHRGSAVMVGVADRGPGVPAAHQEAIFRKFHQVARKPRTHGGGVGLGLAICREIVQAHEGQIWMTDRAGGGSIFHVLLPAASPPGPAPRAAAPLRPLETTA